MLAFTVPDTKLFMANLLKADTFDRFHTRSIELSTSIRYFIDCGIQKDYYPKAQQEDLYKYKYWKDMRSLVYQLIKGEHPPLFFKIILSVDDNGINCLCPDASAMFLNINYTGANDNTQGGVYCTTGASEKSFSLEKKAIAAWDDYVTKFFKHYGIPTETTYE